MAHRPRAYGLTAEVNNKIKNKYEPEDEKKVLAWIAEVSNLIFVFISFQSGH